MVVVPVIPATQSLRREDCEFEASLGQSSKILLQEERERTERGEGRVGGGRKRKRERGGRERRRGEETDTDR
jgi:hypothetical protein